jgi:malate dehydrogenase (oxaloacetate-decarboxylating)
MTHPSASFSATLRIQLDNHPGSFARLAATIGEAGGLLDAIDLVRVEADRKVRDVTVIAGDAAHLHEIVRAVEALEGVEVEHVSDRTFLMHLGGKIRMEPKTPIETRDQLSMAYTPGVARISREIADHPEKVWNLTIKQNSVAVVSDGSAVLGLGDIGPEAAMPVMEGKAVLFKEFGGVDAWPICLATNDVDEIVSVVKALAPGFGGINLEDISAPRCFEIEARLRAELDIPVFHDDQFQAAGVGEVVGCDRRGALHGAREGLEGIKAEYAQTTNPRGVAGTPDEALAGVDVFIGLSGPGVVTRAGVESMRPDPIIFAMANPAPEIAPEEIEGLAAVIATGRSDYPNQINNVLAFPGIFRGALDVRASAITPRMELAAAEAIAGAVDAAHLERDYIVPSVFNREVAPAVATAVAAAAQADGVARRRRRAPVRA